MRTRELVAILAALVVVAGAVGVQGQQLLLANWDVVYTYELDADGNVTDFTEDGDILSKIECTGDWNLVENITDTVDHNDWIIQSAVDVLDGEIAYLEMKDGDETKKVLRCDVFTTEPLSSQDWLVLGACSDGTVKTSIGVRVGGVQGDAPSETAKDTGVNDPGSPDCVFAEAARPNSGFTPFTGLTKAKLLDQNNEMVAEVSFTTVAGLFRVTADWEFGTGLCTQDDCLLQGRAQAKLAEVPVPTGVGTWGASVECNGC